MKNIFQKLNELLCEAQETCIELYEFASPLSVVRSNVHNKSNDIIEHICKVILYKDIHKTTVHHWCAEILADLLNCTNAKIKATKTTPSKEQLNKWLLDYWRKPEDLENLVWGLQIQYGKTDVDLKDLHNKIVLAIDKLTTKLAQKDISIQIIEDILK